MVLAPGFEPSLVVPKTTVLPLYEARWSKMSDLNRYSCSQSKCVTITPHPRNCYRHLNIPKIFIKSCWMTVYIKKEGLMLLYHTYGDLSRGNSNFFILIVATPATIVYENPSIFFPIPNCAIVFALLEDEFIEFVFFFKRFYKLIFFSACFIEFKCHCPFGPDRHSPSTQCKKCSQGCSSCSELLCAYP